MNRVTVRHIDVVRAANVVAVLYTVVVIVIGLLFFVPLALIGGLAGLSSGDSEIGAAVGVGLVGGIVIFAVAVVFYGVLGWITTAIACWLYNLVAARIGGVRFVADVEGPYPGGGYPAVAPGQGMPAVAPGAPSSAPMAWPAPGGGPPPAPGA